MPSATSMVKYSSEVLTLTDWTDDKNLGPWTFVEQKNKWGYLNDPRWKKTSEDTTYYDSNPALEPQVWTPHNRGGYSRGDRRVHFQCGHWHKTTNAVPPVIYDIYWQLARGTDSVVHVLFDESSMSLTYLGIYQPALHINSMAWYGDDLIIPAGSGVTACILEIDQYLNLIATHTPYNQYDKEGANDNGSILVIDDGIFQYEPMGTDNFERIMKFDSSLNRVARYLPHTIVLGTDLNHYAFRYPSGLSSWPPGYGIPITGAVWTAFWRKIPDGLFDAITEVGYGVGTVVSGASVSGNMSTDGEHLFVTSWATPNSLIQKVDPTDGSLLAAVETSPWGITSICYGDYLYVMCGVTTATLTKHNKSDLAKVATLPLPYGMGSASPNESIIEMNGKILAVNGQYIPSDEPVMYKIDPNSMTIVQTKLLESGSNTPLCLHNIDDRYILVGFNVHLAVYDFDTMEELATLDQPAIGAPYPFYSTCIRSKAR